MKKKRFFLLKRLTLLTVLKDYTVAVGGGTFSPLAPVLLCRSFFFFKWPWVAPVLLRYMSVLNKKRGYVILFHYCCSWHLSIIAIIECGIHFVAETIWAFSLDQPVDGNFYF